MSYCEICDKYCEDVVPVSFTPSSVDGEPIPEEIEHLVDWERQGMMDDMEIASHEDYTPYICGECYGKYSKWIVWSG